MDTETKLVSDAELDSIWDGAIVPACPACTRIDHVPCRECETCAKRALYNAGADDLNDAMNLIEKAQWSSEIDGEACCPWCGACEKAPRDTDGVHCSDCEAALFLRTHGREVQIADPDAKETRHVPPEQTICFFSPGSFPAEPGPIDAEWLIDLAKRALQHADVEVHSATVEACSHLGQSGQRVARVIWSSGSIVEGCCALPCCVDLEPCENGYAFRIVGKLAYRIEPDTLSWIKISGNPVFCLPYNMGSLLINTGWKIYQAAENVGQKIPWKKQSPCIAPGPVCSKGVVP